MHITVAGAGYVGLANAIMLAGSHKVTLVDVDEERVRIILKGISPIADRDLQDFLTNHELDLTATTDGPSAYRDADYVFIATPTDYDEKSEELDASTVVQVVEDVLRTNSHADILVKSTVPVGFTKKLADTTGYETIFFSPEFLREGRALYDCLHPSRIIVGMASETEAMERKALAIARLMAKSSHCDDQNLMIVGSSEAEAIKLFSNTYLAMRICFFNELDSYSERNGLDPSDIIKGIGMDARIGMHYNNPSFGYGGYCLPKDTKQMRAQFSKTPQDLMGAIVDSNETRKHFIASQVIKRDPDIVGIYRLVMKEGSDNFRESSMLDVMNEISSHGIEIVIYEPLVKEATYEGFKVQNDLNGFAEACDIILANRVSDEIKPYIKKVYTRDVFGDS